MIDKIPNIPIVAMKTKNKDKNPRCGCLGRALQSNLMPIDRKYPDRMLWWFVISDTLAVTPSSDDGPPAVLLMLVGWI
jgi:hypothetical protein